MHAARPPFGLRPIRRVEDGKPQVSWEINPDEAATLREMFHLTVEENLGFKAIADRLNADRYRSRTGAPFASFTVSQALHNTAIVGTLRYGKQARKGNPQQEQIEVLNFFPPIFSILEWEKLQERLAIRRESPRGQAHASAHILTGIARCGQCAGPLTGKVGMGYKGKRYRNYWCSRSLRSKAFCGVANGHSTKKLEAALLKYLGQFSDPARVQQLVVESDAKETSRAESELKRVARRLDVIEEDFHKHLEWLKRGVINEIEFAKANTAAREEAEALEERRATLASRLGQDRDRDRAAMVAKAPAHIGAFLEDFQGLDPRLQKAQLQTILKAVHVWNDGRIELEFRA